MRDKTKTISIKNIIPKHVKTENSFDDTLNERKRSRNHLKKNNYIKEIFINKTIHT